MSHETQDNTELMGLIIGLILTGIGAMTLALVIAIVSSFPDRATVQEGITGDDLRFAVKFCKPHDPTFEQTLACYQAVYGGILK